MKNNITTKLPLTSEQIEQYYATINLYHFDIILKDCTELSAKQIINYIANTKMDCDLILDDADDTLITELIKEYVTTNRQVSIPVFNKIIINALESIIMNSKNPANKEFIENNFKLLHEVLDTLVNLKFAADIMIAGDEYDNTILKLEEKENNIGTNIISLRKEEEFWNLYVLLEFARNKLTYNKLFIEPCIKGYSMLYFLTTEKNPVGVAVRNLQEVKM